MKAWWGALLVLLALSRCSCPMPTHIDIADGGSLFRDAAVFQLPDAGVPDASVPMLDAGASTPTVSACWILAAIDRIRIDQQERDRCTRMLLERTPTSTDLDIDAGRRWAAVVAASAVDAGCDDAVRLGVRAFEGEGAVLVHEMPGMRATAVDVNVRLGFMASPDFQIAMQQDSVPVAPDCATMCLPDAHEEDDWIGVHEELISSFGTPFHMGDLTACPGDLDLFHAYADCCLQVGADITYSPERANVTVSLLKTDGSPIPLDGADDVVTMSPGFISVRKADFGGEFYIEVESDRAVNYTMDVIAPVFE